MDDFKIPDAIQWHEGLLLTPQHFQQLTLRQEALLQCVSQTVAPFYWGVTREPKLDGPKLAGGTFEVKELEAVMPDSLVVSSGPGDDLELTVDLNPFKDEMAKGPVAVHLAIPAQEWDSLTKGDRPRYKSSDGRPVINEETDEQVYIRRLRPHLTLEVGEKLSSKFVSFPLARVKYRDETFVRASDYIPPCLSVTPKSELGTLCLSAAELLRKKAAFLADKMRGPEGERDESRIETHLRSLVAPLPALEAILSTGAAHPFQVYLALCNVLGHVSVMGSSPLPPALADYDHNDLHASFREVISHIEDKVEEGINTTFTVFQFKHAGDFYSLHFEGEWMRKRLAIGIRGQAGMSEQDVIRWGKECIIGSQGRLPSLRDKRVTGAGRKLIVRDGDLVPPRGVLLFALSADPEHVEPDEVLQIFNAGQRSNSPRPSEILLYVRGGQPWHIT